MIRHGISSAPVYDKEKDSFVGMLDYRDIATYILLAFTKDPPVNEESVEVQELIKRARSNATVTARLASDISFKDPFYSVMAETPLRMAIEIFALGVHRISVMGNNGILGILSQSTVVSYLWKSVRYLRYLMSNCSLKRIQKYTMS